MRNTTHMPLPSMPNSERMIAEVKKLRKTIIGAVILLITGLLLYHWYDKGFPLPALAREETNPHVNSNPFEVFEHYSSPQQRIEELRKEYPNASPDELSQMVINESNKRIYKQ